MSADDASARGSQRRGVDPSRLAPLFWTTAALHAAALASRFTDVAEHIPDAVAVALLFAHVPLLVIEGYFEGRIDYGTARSDLPLWMRIDSRAVKVSFTLAFTYLAVAVLQTWDIAIGPIDPTPPAEWDLGLRAYWFGIMSVGMFFPNYLATSSLLIPVLRAITAPLRALPTAIAIIFAAAMGVALAIGLAFIAGPTSTMVGAWASLLAQRPGVAILVTVAVVLVPVLASVVGSDGDG